MHNILETKYPIVCAPMFGVSDINLALAIAEAGCFPTFVDLETAEQYLKETGSNKFSLFFTISPFYDQELLDMKKILKLNPAQLDITFNRNFTIEQILLSKSIKVFFTQCNKQGIRLIRKIISPGSNHLEYFNGVNIKGNSAAGYVSDDYDTKQAFLLQKQQSKLPIYPAGSISTGQDIDWFLQKGASGVYIGSLFAMTKESKIDNTVKEKMLLANTNEKITNGNFNGISFSPITELHKNYNFSTGLIAGVTGQGGHVYIGNGISNINEIVTVKQLVQRLVNESSMLSITVSSAGR
jgi:NAD(P)H-dependent flavin oxidoreductase YrpB (nitropropane dioxygenase family)